YCRSLLARLSEWLRLSSHLVREIVWLQRLYTPSDRPLVSTTDQFPAHSHMGRLPPRTHPGHLQARTHPDRLSARRHTGHLPARTHTGRVLAPLETDALRRDGGKSFAF